MEIGEKIKKLRQEKDYTQRSLADELTKLLGKKFVFQQVGSMEKGTRPVSIQELKALQKIFKVTLSFLAVDEKDYPPTGSDRLAEGATSLIDIGKGEVVTPEKPITYKGHDKPKELDTVCLPYFGHIIAGDPSVATQGRLGDFPVLKHLWGPNRYVLKVEGDSMLSTFKPDDLILIQNVTNGNIRDYNGRICTVLYRSESTLKRVFVRDNEIQLKPDNPYMPTIVVKPPEEVVIQGWAVAIVWREDI